MPENPLRANCIVALKTNLEARYVPDPNVFIAGNLLWYPVEGDTTICQAGDVIAVFGRPKGYRGSYRQWEEGGIAPQVVFEILSPSNRLKEMVRKFKFYERYGVQEYYVYNPDTGALDGYQRQGNELVEILFMQGWVSPLLGVKFQVVGTELELYRPDGRKFATFAELHKQREQAEQRAAQEKQRADEEAERAAQEKQRADEQAEQNARLLAKLKALGIDPDA